MRKKTAFSLMETMTLLLILSLVAAATVPLVTKRTLNENHGWYACYHTVDPTGVTFSDSLRQIRVENKTEGGEIEMISHKVNECVFDFPTGNPRPKKYTITAIGAGADLTYAQRQVNLRPVDGAGEYEYRDPNPELRRHRILSDTWGYLLSPVTLDDIISRNNGGAPYTVKHTYSDGSADSNYKTYPAGLYGSEFGTVDATCGGMQDTFCTPTAGEYIRSEYRLNDSDSNAIQRLKIKIGKPDNTTIQPYKLANMPESPEKMKTKVTDATGKVIVEAQGGYIYRRSNPVSKIIVPVYDELACKKDGLKLCPQVDGCTMNDYRVCMDSGFITDSQFLGLMSGKYPMQNTAYPEGNTSFWLSNRLIHTPDIFDGQPEYEAFINIYQTGLPDSGCDANGENCKYVGRKLAFGDPTLVYFTKRTNQGRAFRNIIKPDSGSGMASDISFSINNTYYPAHYSGVVTGDGSTYHEQTARPGMVFITW